MSADPKTIVHRWFNEVWNQGREDTIDELAAPGVIGHGLGEATDTVGPADFKVFWRNMRSALPDITIRIEDTIVDGDKVVVRVVLEGTHRGDGLGVAASGQRVNIAGVVIVRVGDGQIVEAWNSWDQLGLLRQIGAIPAPDQDRFLSAGT